MTQNWVSSLSSLQNKNIDTVWHRKLWIKIWHNSRNLCKYW